MSTEKDNRMVWDRSSPGLYEVWYCTFNHLPSRTGYWVRYTLEAPQPDHGEPYCQLWFAFFDAEDPQRNFGINRKLPISALAYQEDPFRLDLGGAVLQHHGLQGTLSGDAHEVSWDLGFKPSSFTHRHLPDVVYNTGFADTRVLSPNLMVYLTGQVTVDGQRYDFDAQPGGQTHLWGRKHAHAHAWSHCSAFREDGTACLETLSLRLKRLGLVTPTMTLLSLYLGSEVYHFRAFRKLPRTRGSWETGLYKFRAVGNRVKIEGEMRCRPEDLIQAPYVDPDGEPRFCHNTEVADASVTVWTRRSLGSPFKSVARLTSHGAAHFEYVSHSPDGHVSRRHVSVP
jgi:hypothetical protein